MATTAEPGNIEIMWWFVTKIVMCFESPNLTARLANGRFDDPSASEMVSDVVVRQAFRAGHGIVTKSILASPQLVTTCLRPAAFRVNGLVLFGSIVRTHALDALIAAAQGTSALGVKGRERFGHLAHAAASVFTIGNGPRHTRILPRHLSEVIY